MGERSDEITREGSFYERDAGSADTSDIRENIEQTRNEMSHTIEAIQERLSPDHLKEQVKEQMREQFEEAKSTVREATIGKAEAMVRNAGDTVSDARTSFMETIRQNPIPSAMIGIGLGWLLMNGRSSGPRQSSAYRGVYSSGYTGSPSYYEGQRGYTGSPSYYEGQRGYSEPGVVERGQQAVGHTVHRAQQKAGDVASRVQETVGDLADKGQSAVGGIAQQAQETVGGIAQQAQETAGTIAYQAQHQAQRVEDRFQQAIIENPLAVGAVALALGAAVGLAIPQTERENQLMGEARDTLVERAQNVAQEAVEQVQQVAGQVLDQAETTVKDQARERGVTSS